MAKWRSSIYQSCKDINSHSFHDTTSHTDLDWAVNEQWEDSSGKKSQSCTFKHYKSVCVWERERRRESLIPIETVRQTLTKRKYFISWSAVCLSVCLSSCHTPCGAEPIGIFLWWHIHWAQRATWHSSLWTLTHRHTHTHTTHTINTTSTDLPVLSIAADNEMHTPPSPPCLLFRFSLSLWEHLRLFLSILGFG